ncbi:MAG: general secretion pathway protein GspD [Gammaproteobacteria bacterium]|nr:general secretion pathway protein GspD [Gammaproteobacteria bacterium]
MLVGIRFTYYGLVLLLFAGCTNQTKNIRDEAQEHDMNVGSRINHVASNQNKISELIKKADHLTSIRQWQAAADVYKEVQSLDGANYRAKMGLEEIDRKLKHEIELIKAEQLISNNNLFDARKVLRAILVEDPKNAKAAELYKHVDEKNLEQKKQSQLDNALGGQITLEFKNAKLKSVFEILSKKSNINFVFDKDVKLESQISIFFDKTTIRDAVDLLLLTNTLEKKNLNENSILIYPNTPAKAKEFKELVVKNFYLSNAKAKETADLLRTVLKTKNIYVDERLDMLVIRDTPEAIKIAEKLVKAQDLAESEVMLEMEVMEVSKNRLQELGIQYPERLSTSIIGSEGQPGSLSLNDALNVNRGLVNLSVTDPLLVFNLRKVDTGAELLANPKIRVKNREKAKIHIGERVPVITTTSTANIGVSESVTYLDVGLKLEMDPEISLDREVTIKVGLEVSNILETITRPTGTQTYRLGTRNASTVLRLRDGETQVLAGLIQDDKRKSANKVPLLGDIPVLGRFFSNHGDTDTKNEVVLLITPHIIRNINKPEHSITEYLSGTESSIGVQGLAIKSGAGSTSTSLASQQKNDQLGNNALKPPGFDNSAPRFEFNPN